MPKERVFMPIKISGKKFLLRFAWPCVQGKIDAQEKLGRVLIEPADFDELKSLVENNSDPDSVILTLCFPKLIRELRAFAKFRFKDMWSYEVVEEFLRRHKGSGDDCAVKFGIVVKSVATNHISVIVDEVEPIPCFNTYKLPLKRGSEVLIHRGVIFKVGF
jgi:hypothetical protein